MTDTNSTYFKMGLEMAAQPISADTMAEVLTIVNEAEEAARAARREADADARTGQ